MLPPLQYHRGKNGRGVGYIVVQTSPCGFRRPLTSPSPPQEQAPGLTLGCFSTEMSHEFRGSGWSHGTGSLCPPGGPLADSLSHVYIEQLFAEYRA